jgi:hypothetical protein
MGQPPYWQPGRSGLSCEASQGEVEAAHQLRAASRCSEARDQLGRLLHRVSGATLHPYGPYLVSIRN